jgi:DNA repair protein RadC
MENDITIKKFKNFVGELTATYRRTSLPTVKINSSVDIFKFIYPYFDAIMDDHEEVKVIHLNRSNHVVNVHHVSSGSDNASIVEIKDILRHAILIKTNSIVLVHNHPSGNLKQSKADEAITNRLKIAVEYFDIKLVDSIIVTREFYKSFRDDGIL